MLPALSAEFGETKLLRDGFFVFGGPIVDALARWALHLHQIILRHNVMITKLKSPEPLVGIEPTTYSLPWSCSTTELQRHSFVLRVHRASEVRAPHSKNACPSEAQRLVERRRKLQRHGRHRHKQQTSSTVSEK